MAKSILIFLDEYPRETIVIGKILLSYNELEHQMVRLAGAALDGDDATATRIIFRVKSEASRLDLTDAIGRLKYEKHGLGGVFKDVIDAFKRCKLIRNQYAHCSFSERGNHAAGIWYANIETGAKSQTEAMPVTIFPTDLSLLIDQLDYFYYADQLCEFAIDAFRKKAGLLPIRDLSKPSKVRAPNLHSPLKGRPHPKIIRAKKPPQAQPDEEYRKN